MNTSIVLQIAKRETGCGKCAGKHDTKECNSIIVQCISRKSPHEAEHHDCLHELRKDTSVSNAGKCILIFSQPNPFLFLSLFLSFFLSFFLDRTDANHNSKGSATRN